MRRRLPSYLNSGAQVMQRRQFLSHTLFGVAGASLIAARRWRPMPRRRPPMRAPEKIDKIVKTERRVAARSSPRNSSTCCARKAPSGRSASPLNNEKRKGTVRLRRLRAAALPVADEIRQRHRLAELLPIHRRPSRDVGRPQAHPSAHRVSLRTLRRASRSRVRRRSQAHGPSLLQQRRRAEVHSRLTAR